MLISTRSRYALRVLARMARMARSNDNAPISLSELSQHEQISVRYLEQIFGKLRTTGIVKGKRGPGGGYVFGIPPGDITLFDIVSILETEFLPASCISDGAECSPSNDYRRTHCPLEISCVTRPLWMHLRDMYYSFMKGHTLSQLADGGLDWKE